MEDYDFTKLKPISDGFDQRVGTIQVLVPFEIDILCAMNWQQSKAAYKRIAGPLEPEMDINTLLKNMITYPCQATDVLNHFIHCKRYSYWESKEREAENKGYAKGRMVLWELEAMVAYCSEQYRKASPDHNHQEAAFVKGWSKEVQYIRGS